MTYAVCARYCGAVVMLDEFDDQEDAEHFAQNPCVMFHADEILDAEEDEVIYPNEMWIEKRDEEKEIPFSDPPMLYELSADDLPF